MVIYLTSHAKMQTLKKPSFHFAKLAKSGVFPRELGRSTWRYWEVLLNSLGPTVVMHSLVAAGQLNVLVLVLAAPGAGQGCVMHMRVQLRYAIVFHPDNIILMRYFLKCSFYFFQG